MKRTDRIARHALIIIALAGLGIGLAALSAGRPEVARAAWTAGTSPVIAFLAAAIVRDLYSGRMGVDILALLSMSVALTLDQALAGAIVAVMYAGGQALEDFAVGRAERSLKELIDRAPRIAHRKGPDGVVDIPIERVAVGDVLLVPAGEVIPIDGQVIGATAVIDESVLTGEPLPVMRQTGEAISSGAINAGESFEMRAMSTAGDSAYAGIVRLVTAAQTAKAPFIRIADRFALLLVPFTLVVTAFAWWSSSDATRALAVLVTATPCPLILAAPAAFIGGTSLAARRGILVKGGGPLEILARIRTVMFDKTGTLTVGGARLVAVETAAGVAPDKALQLAASLEQASHHVLAATIVSVARDKGLPLYTPQDIHEVLGSGLEGVIEGRKVSVGSLQFVHGEGRLEEWARRAARRASWRSALTVFVALDGSVIAVLLFADELRRETPRAIQALRRAGVGRIVMVTGDRTEPAETIGAALDLDTVLAERVPSDKVDAVVTERRLAPTLMVGDGINDAPALAAANVGLAMGARGASASSEAADAVIVVDRLDRVAEAVAIARRTRNIAIQSMVAGMGLSGVAMIGATFGYVTPVVGALIQEAIDVAVIINALRALAPPNAFDQVPMSEAAATILREDHERVETTLERLRQIADALDSVMPGEAVKYILEANSIVETSIVRHEREDEAVIYPRVSDYLKDDHGLSAMSRAHREILHQARLLARLAEGLRPAEAEPYLIRDAQRIIESIESLVHIHNAQEEDIYEHAAEKLGLDSRTTRGKGSLRSDRPGLTALEGALGRASLGRRHGWVLASVAAMLILVAAGGYWGRDYFGRFHYSAPPKERAGGKITATGIIKDTTAPIKASVSGVIESVSCDVGSFVRAGQVCARIDPEPYRLLLERSYSELAQAKWRVGRAQVDLARARSSYQRNLSISKRKALSATALESSRRVLEERQAAAVRAEGNAALAQAAIKVADSGLRHTSILSPVEGTVVRRNAAVGQTVQEGQSEALFNVALDPNNVQIDARVDAPLADALQIGDVALFWIAGQPTHTFVGKITELSLDKDTAEPMQGLNIVILAAASKLLEPGMSVAIEISTARTDSH